MAFEPEMPES